MSGFDRSLALAFLLACAAGCNFDAKKFQEKHRLYLKEPDLVRERQVRLGMSVETVTEKLGDPALRLANRIGGRDWSSWTYVTSEEAWSPPGSGDDENEAWPAGRGARPTVVNRERLHLIFLDGRLVAIEDPVYRHFEVSETLEPPDKETVERLRRKLYGDEKGRGTGR